MDSATTELARRLAAHPKWRWRGGMAPLHVDGLAYRNGTWIPDSIAAGQLDGNPYHFPDLEDPATWGCLLAMLWEVLRDERHVDLDLSGDDRGARVMTMRCDYLDEQGEDRHYHDAPTPGAAIAAALLEAWGSPDA